MISYSKCDLDAPVQTQPPNAQEAMNPDHMLAYSWRKYRSASHRIPHNASCPQMHVSICQANDAIISPSGRLKISPPGFPQSPPPRQREV